jgi:hypothetical protein
LGQGQVEVEVEQQGVQVARCEQIFNLEVMGLQKVIKKEREL